MSLDRLCRGILAILDQQGRYCNAELLSFTASMYPKHELKGLLLGRKDDGVDRICINKTCQYNFIRRHVYKVWE